MAAWGYNALIWPVDSTARLRGQGGSSRQLFIRVQFRGGAAVADHAVRSGLRIESG